MKWEWEIKPETSWLEFNFKELWAYRHLLFRLVRRDFLTLYQQTLLGPVWVVLQPLLTVIMYVGIFNEVVKIPIGGVPPVLFYLSGIIVWNLFAEIFNSTAFTFTTNATLFSKVYFPRLVIPFSITASHIIRFFIQFGLFAAFYTFYVLKGDINAEPLHMPAMVIMTLIVIPMLALGAGLSFAVFIAKYRDLGNLIQLCLRLLMFATPIIYPMSFVENPRIQQLLVFNPLVPVIELFRYSFLGTGTFSGIQLLYSAGVSIFIFFVGAMLFNRMGAKLIDVV